MDIQFLTAAVEAVLYASPTPVDPDRLAAVIGVDKEELLTVFDKIFGDCMNENRGIELLCKNGMFMFATKKDFGQIVSGYLASRRPGLSSAAMEVLAIAAYNQPVTKTYISQIRGVSSSEIVESLVEKGLLAEDGKFDVPGKPMGYVTTEKFLAVFNLDSLDDLPENDLMRDAAGDFYMSGARGQTILAESE